MFETDRLACPRPGEDSMDLPFSAADTARFPGVCPMADVEAISTQGSAMMAVDGVQVHPCAVCLRQPWETDFPKTHVEIDREDVKEIVEAPFGAGCHECRSGVAMAMPISMTTWYSCARSMRNFRLSNSHLWTGGTCSDLHSKCPSCDRVLAWETCLCCGLAWCWSPSPEELPCCE